MITTWKAYKTWDRDRKIASQGHESQYPTLTNQTFTQQTRNYFPQWSKSPSERLRYARLSKSVLAYAATVFHSSLLAYFLFSCSFVAYPHVLSLLKRKEKKAPCNASNLPSLVTFTGNSHRQILPSNSPLHPLQLASPSDPKTPPKNSGHGRFIRRASEITSYTKAYRLHNLHLHSLPHPPHVIVKSIAGPSRVYHGHQNRRGSRLDHRHCHNKWECRRHQEIWED